MLTRAAAVAFTERVFQFFLLIGLLCSIATMMLIAYWLWWPVTVMTIVQPVRVSNSPVRLPGSLEYVMEYCKDPKFINNYALVQHTLTDSLVYTVPGFSGPLDSGCHTVNVDLELPKLPPGTYILEMTRTYTVNPIRRVVIRSKTAPFAVVN